MTCIEHEFIHRLSRIPPHGLGVSVDVYSPNLFELLDVFASCGVGYGYLEIFKASRSALADVRGRLPGELLEYHAEGLWLTQPDWGAGEADRRDIFATASDLATLGCHWINHECATKQMAGFSFGTYLPPLFTAVSADVTAAHAMQLQHQLKQSGQFAAHREPLVLLEIPPLTYFAFGNVPVTEFFRRIADQSACGFVLDLGHVWTYYRYSGDWRRRSLSSFLAEFLDGFPLERVVQIHLAGLAVHESASVQRVGDGKSQEPPLWLDAHHAPIPDVLFEMLDQILGHPNLHSLKGLALEVDTKAIVQIVEELNRAHMWFGKRLSDICRQQPWRAVTDAASDLTLSPSVDTEHQEDAMNGLRRQYAAYAGVISGQVTASQAGLPSHCLEPAGLDAYQRSYLPYEILHWGGDLRQMFPNTCRQLAGEGIEVSRFVDFWFRTPHARDQSYDYFLLKLDRFVEFVRDLLPSGVPLATHEADELRQAYQTACDQVVQPQEARA